MWFGDLVVNPTAFTLAGEEPTPLHQSQVFRSHIIWNAAIFRQLAYRVPTLQQQLHHSQPHRVR